MPGHPLEEDFVCEEETDSVDVLSEEDEKDARRPMHVLLADESFETLESFRANCPQVVLKDGQPAYVVSVQERGQFFEACQLSPEP